MLVSAMRRASHKEQIPRYLHENATSLSWAQIGAAHSENPVREDAAFEKGIELGFDKLG